MHDVEVDVQRSVTQEQALARGRSPLEILQRGQRRVARYRSLRGHS